MEKRFPQPDKYCRPPKPVPLKGAETVRALLDIGRRSEARAYAKAYGIQWFKKAEKGGLMNLTDLLAIRDELVMDDHAD